jgi:hypothetical protein
MPIYILKRFHTVTPSETQVWHLGREIAFEAADEHSAIQQAQDKHLADMGTFGGIAILYDWDAKRIWERTFP